METSKPKRRVVLAADLNRFPVSHGLWARTSRRLESRHDKVREAVATTLTERQRIIIEAYFFEGVSQAAIAERLGVTQQVIQKAIWGDQRNGRRVGGALKKLESALGPLLSL
jgi:predicted DNA-binding protein YlxM (UPF0122 family)